MTGWDGAITEMLSQMATPALYRGNAFRITRLPVTAGAAQIRRATERLRIASAIGDGPSVDEHSTQEATQEAQRRLRDPVRRLVDEFFWFWPEDDGVTFDPSGDTGAAESRWQQLSDEDGGPAGAIARHNLAVLTHLRAVESAQSINDSDGAHGESLWRQAFTRWGAVLADDVGWRWLALRATEANDPRVGQATVEQLRLGLPSALVAINVTLAATAAQHGDTTKAAGQIRILQGSGLPEEVVTQACVTAVEPIAERLRRLCETAGDRAGAEPAAANVPARELLDAARPLLGAVDAVLPPGHPAAEGLHDDVARSVRGCVVIYGNSSEDWARCAGLLELASKVAATDATRSLIDAAIDTVRRNKELDEQSKLCWFCKSRSAVPKVAHKFEMHGDVQRVLGGRRYRQLTVEVPRCASCLRGVVIEIAAIAIYALSALVFIVGVIAASFVTIAASAVVFAVAFGVAVRVGKGQDSARDFPGVQLRLKEGWLTGQAPGENEGESSTTTPGLKPLEDRPKIARVDIKRGCRFCDGELSVAMAFKEGAGYELSAQCKQCRREYALQL